MATLVHDLVMNPAEVSRVAESVSRGVKSCFLVPGGQATNANAVLTLRIVYRMCPLYLPARRPGGVLSILYNAAIYGHSVPVCSLHDLRVLAAGKATYPSYK